MKITASSKLMKNHKHASKKVINSNMKACQMASGNAILFSIAADNSFHITCETHGHKTGWKTYTFFQGTCKNFDVFQNFNDPQNVGIINLSVVVTVNGKDVAYNSYLNPYQDDFWLNPQQPDEVVRWELFLFSGNQPPNLFLTNVFIDNSLFVAYFEQREDPYKSYIMAHFDIRTKTIIGDYYIPLMSSRETNQTFFGKRTGDHTTSIYFGKIGEIGGGPSSDGIFYANYNQDKIINSLPFNLIVFTYLANYLNSFTTSYANDGSTHLFATYRLGNSTIGRLQFIGSDKQANNMQMGGFIDNGGITVKESPLLADVVQLLANTTPTETIIWGVNKQGQLFRIKCTKGQEENPAAWSEPISIVSGITRIAPYYNRFSGLSTIFAQTTDRGLIKLKQDPATKIWQERSVLLPTTVEQEVIEYDSFTTYIKCIDDTVPPKNPLLNITSDSQATFYINDQYYHLNPNIPVAFQPDELSTLTIVQETHSLSAVKFKVSEPVSGITIDINPSKEIMDTILKVDSWDKLANIKVYDELNAASNLVTINPSEKAKGDFVRIIQNLKTANDRFNRQTPRGEGPSTTWGMSFGSNDWQYQEVQNAGLAPRDVSINGNPIDPTRALELIVEDAFKWLKGAYSTVSDFLIKEVTEGFHLLVKVGESIYRIVINSANALIHATEFIFNKLQIGFEKLKQWLGYVFNWSDFVVTHNFLKTMFNVYSDNVVNGINSFTGNVETLFNNMTTDVISWANISTLPKIVAGNNPPPDSFYTPHGYYMIHHYKNGSMSVGNPQALTINYASESLFDEIKSSIDRDLATLSNFKDILYNEIIIPFKTLTVEQIAKKIIDMLVVETLQLMKNTLVSILNIIRDYTLRAIESIHKPIDFPVISWLYKKYVGSTLTCLDVVCLVCAVPATIAYKAATNTAPFKKDDPLTNNLINARDLATFQALLASTVSNNSQQTNRDTPPQNILAKNIAVFLGGLATIPATAVMIINNNFLVQKVMIDGYKVLAGDTPQILKLNVYNAIATIFYVSPNLPGTADTDHWYQKMNTAFTYGTIVKALAGLVFNGDKSTLALNCVEGIMNFAWNAPVIANIVQEKDNATYFGLIPESIADFSFNIGGMLTPAIQIFAKRPPQGPAIAAVLYFGQKITMGVYSGGIAISGIDKLVRSNGS